MNLEKNKTLWNIYTKQIRKIDESVQLFAFKNEQINSFAVRLITQPAETGVNVTIQK
jgi:hypothetical protein